MRQYVKGTGSIQPNPLQSELLPCVDCLLALSVVPVHSNYGKFHVYSPEWDYNLSGKHNTTLNTDGSGT